ncbi:MAG TPA: hypothetical protein VF181_11570 [Balneolaceae bacterium]
MKSLSQIPALFLVILLALSSISKANPVNNTNGHTREKTTSIHPADTPNLFAIRHQEKTEVNLLDRLPRSNSTDYSKNYSFGFQFAKSCLQRRAAIFLWFYKAIDRSLTVKKLIFPFHSHW